MVEKPESLIYSPSDFVAVANQALEYTFGLAYIEGELANFKISKNKWVYFDIKDDNAKVSCFASIYILPGPLQDGMLVRISGTGSLHPQYGFSVTVQSIQPTGEGAIKKAFELLKAKLSSEGLFDESRKRFLPYPPTRIALVASVESAGYADFIKIITARWPFVEVDVYDTQVQGDLAPEQLAVAIKSANSDSKLADVLVLTRGGGSADDLAAFNDERVVRAVAASRVPTLVAIGHEIDESLAELAADQRASTPSNAAELLVPDKKAETQVIGQTHRHFAQACNSLFNLTQETLLQSRLKLNSYISNTAIRAQDELKGLRHILLAYDPNMVLRRGYAIVKSGAKLVRQDSDVQIGGKINVTTNQVVIDATVTSISKRSGNGR